MFYVYNVMIMCFSSIDNVIHLKSTIHTNDSCISTDLLNYQYYHKANRFISIAFETLDEYTEHLQYISQQINHYSYGTRSLIFLAAAVSDFYLSLDKVSNNNCTSKKTS